MNRLALAGNWGNKINAALQSTAAVLLFTLSSSFGCMGPTILQALSDYIIVNE